MNSVVNKVFSLQVVERIRDSVAQHERIHHVIADVLESSDITKLIGYFVTKKEAEHYVLLLFINGGERGI